MSSDKAILDLLVLSELDDIEKYVVVNNIDPLTTPIDFAGILSLSLVGCAFSISRIDVINKYMRGVTEATNPKCSPILDILIATRNKDTIEFLECEHFNIMILYRHLHDAIESGQLKLARYIMDRLPPKLDEGEDCFSKSVEYKVVKFSDEETCLHLMRWRSSSRRFPRELLCHAAHNHWKYVVALLLQEGYSCKSSPSLLFPSGIHQNYESYIN